VSGRRLSKNVCLWLSSRILPHSQSAASSQHSRPGLVLRVSPAKTLGCCRLPSARRASCNNSAVGPAVRWEAADIKAGGRQICSAVAHGRQWSEWWMGMTLWMPHTAAGCCGGGFGMDGDRRFSASE
jgi:hypothetical protein